MAETAISTTGLSKRYGASIALSDLNLEVPVGEVLGYLGPNGAGKTTTIHLLLGLIHPSAGRASIFGLDCQHQAVEAHRRLAYVPGEANLWPSLTGAETLHLLGRVQGSVDEAYRDVGATPRDRWPDFVKTFTSMSRLGGTGSVAADRTNPDSMSTPTSSQPPP